MDGSEREQGAVTRARPGVAAGRAPLIVGGRLCLDFSNTIGGRGGTDPEEFLPARADLVAWAALVGLVAPERSAAILSAAEADPRTASRGFDEAMALRETIYAVFAPIADGDAAPADALDELRRDYARFLVVARLTEHADGYGWSWDFGDDEPGGAIADATAAILGPVAASAIDLLRHGPLDRVKRCPGGLGPCNWLFVDTTKAGNRRWCSMAECGGQSKARRQTERRRGTRRQ